MNRQLLMGSALCLLGVGAHAQSCEGGLYLNPQVIRGEASSATEASLKELVDFVRPTGLPVTPVLNVRETADVMAAIKRAPSPCWVYGNPVVGLASGYRPVAVNVDPIESAVLILADIGQVKDSKPVELKSLPADQQAKVRAKLKSTSCFGMKSGVTTALVKAENLCGTVVEVLPSQGLGQAYLPTKAAFHWQVDRWAGLITRRQSAMSATMKTHHGSDERIHMAQLVVVPASNPSWGYGIYVHPSISSDVVKKVASRFDALKTSDATLLRALDLGTKFDFVTPDDAAVQEMKKALATSP
ncbi:MAG TPA: hypothetical protein VLJ58_16965 [Ramlibacter sp.]|nr:hypothetical protein [Ramlibacter sp.]